LYKFIRHALVPREAAFSSFAYTQLRAFPRLTRPSHPTFTEHSPPTRPVPNWFFHPEGLASIVNFVLYTMVSIMKELKLKLKPIHAVSCVYYE